MASHKLKKFLRLLRRISGGIPYVMWHTRGSLRAFLGKIARPPGLQLNLYCTHATFLRVCAMPQEKLGIPDLLFKPFRAGS